MQLTTDADVTKDQDMDATMAAITTTLVSGSSYFFYSAAMAALD